MAAITGAGLSMVGRSVVNSGSLGLEIAYVVIVMLASVLITACSWKDILRNIFWMWLVIPCSVVLLAYIISLFS